MDSDQNNIRKPYVLYLKNKTTSEFEYRSDVRDVKSLANGYLITFNNGRSYNYGANNVQYYPLVSTQANVCIYENGKLNPIYNIVDNYGSLLIFRNANFCSKPVDNKPNIEICEIAKNTGHSQSVIDYFKEILNQSIGTSFDIESEEPENVNSNQISAQILLKALDKISITDSRSALSNYLNGSNSTLSSLKKPLVYPFGCNESQKLAVETSLANSMNIVEGPPGTGKTQTILSIIANLIIADKTVAIVSNNNSAVFNIREKLQKCGYGMIVASLGNKENKQSFFDNLEIQKAEERFKLTNDQLSAAKDQVKNLDTVVTQYFEYRNRLATLKAQLSDAKIEFTHIKSEQPISDNIRKELDKKIYRKWNSETVLKFNTLLSNLASGKKLSIKNKLQLIVKFGIFDSGIINNRREDLNNYLNHKFYELFIDKIEREISSIEEWLRSNNEESNLKQLIDKSKDIFNAALYKKYQKNQNNGFTVQNYINRFDEFVKQYPVVLSSTLSLKSSIPDGFLFDYLIIDESSQVDIIKAAVCFSCCRNVVIVGDSLQLNHIIDKDSQTIAENLQKAYHISSAYNYVEQNILDSLKCLYGDNIKSILLKEHYRCHPAIIGFCNKKYYNNSLVVMTNAENHPFKIIETNIAGGRGKYNQRQIDETVLYVKENYSDDFSKVGVIAPYRYHANLLQQQLPAGTEADTIHKYQGREKDVIIFNTVSNQIGEFIDNPNLINVAVSRAVKEFIVVKPASMELPHGTNIGDLIRYIGYTTQPEVTILKSKICSVFDLLYKEYNKKFIDFIEMNRDIKGSPAEIIIHKLLLDEILLPDSQFSVIDMTREYKLRDLIRDYTPFSEEEVMFIRNNSRLDFLLYNKIDKSPVLAIEVDGVSFHDNKLQRERDNKKNQILNIIGLPLLRLSTEGHNEKAKIIAKLSDAMKPESDTIGLNDSCQMDDPKEMADDLQRLEPVV